MHRLRAERDPQYIALRRSRDVGNASNDLRTDSSEIRRVLDGRVRRIDVRSRRAQR